MGAGDVWSITTCLRDAGEVLPNNQTFTWGVMATSDYGDYSDLDAAWQAALPSIMNVLSDGVMAVGAFYRKWLPGAGSTVGRRFPTYIAGGVSAQSLPIASSALVLRQSGFAGRNSNGRLFLPWLPVQYADPAIPNRLVEINRLGIEQACRDVDDALQAGGTGSNWRSVVISTRSLATPGIYATPVTNWTCMNAFRSLPQRARRDYRCPFESRWLVIAPGNSFAKQRSEGFNWGNSGSNPLNWRYWLDGGARGGDDGTPDPNWKLPTFAGTAWHNLTTTISPGTRFCPYLEGPGGVTWPTPTFNPNVTEPPEYDHAGHFHYGRTGGGVPNAGSSFLNSGELDYYRCRFKVTNVPEVLSAFLRINHYDGAAHYINGTEVFNNLGAYDGTPPACRAGWEIDIRDLLLYDNQVNCWAVLHQPFGELGTSIRRYPRYPDYQPPEDYPYDSWWAGEIRVGGNPSA